MKKIIYVCFVFLSFLCSAEEIHHFFKEDDLLDSEYTLEYHLEKECHELLISWNASRPVTGYYLIKVSVLIDKEWTEWQNYAYWGVEKQFTYSSHYQGVKIDQDSVAFEGAKKFKIALSANEGASLEGFRSVHISYQLKKNNNDHEIEVFHSMVLDVPGFSQMALNDERRTRLCSPTSTTAVINYLLRTKDGPFIHPCYFADQVYDHAFDLYGNWALNTAQASLELNKNEHIYSVYFSKFSSFQQIIDQLKKGYPIVVSVKGPLEGSAFLYEKGHLIVVRGYDDELRQVICMDPAFSRNEYVQVRYELNDFIEAWKRRDQVVYVFDSAFDLKEKVN